MKKVLGQSRTGSHAQDQKAKSRKVSHPRSYSARTNSSLELINNTFGILVMTISRTYWLMTLRDSAKTFNFRQAE